MFILVGHIFLNLQVTNAKTGLFIYDKSVVTAIIIFFITLPSFECTVVYFLYLENNIRCVTIVTQMPGRDGFYNIRRLCDDLSLC